MAARLEAMGVALRERDGARTFALEFASEEPQECAMCPLLDSARGCTLPREERPLECRLWPLRLMRGEQGELLLTCYRDCPGIAAVPRGTLLQELESLRPLLLEHAASSPASVRSLHPLYTVLSCLQPCPALGDC